MLLPQHICPCLHRDVSSDRWYIPTVELTLLVLRELFEMTSLFYPIQSDDTNLYLNTTINNNCEYLKLVNGILSLKYLTC